MKNACENHINHLKFEAIHKKKVREKSTAPWYNSITHAIKSETRNLENKWKQTHLVVFRIMWKDGMSHYKKDLKAARAKHHHKLIENNQNNSRFLFSTVARLTNKQINRHHLNCIFQHSLVVMT